MIITKTLSPSPALATYIHHYWIIKTNKTEVSTLIIPMGCMKWMFHRKKPFTVNGITNEKLTTTVCGQYDTAIRIENKEDMEMFCVFFQPYASKLIMGRPCHALMGENVDFDDLEQTEYKDLKRKVEDCADNETAIKEVERFVAQQLYKTEGEANLRTLVHSLKKIVDEPDLRVDQLAASCCLSERQFRRVFNENYGLSPKQMLRIQRLKVATKEIYDSKITNFDEIIYGLGFTDHSHFNKEFQHMVGLSPTEYARYILSVKEQEMISAYRSYHTDKT